MRLSGSLKTIKALERQMKERDESIIDMKKELYSKSKLIEQLENN